MSRTTILVVDRQPHTRAFIRAVLERNGCRILEAADEAGARDALRDTDAPVSLALIDVKRPGQDRRAVARMLEALPAVPVLFMSDDERQLLIAEGRLDPSAELIAKPLTVAGLVSALSARLDPAL